MSAENEKTPVGLSVPELCELRGLMGNRQPNPGQGEAMIAVILRFNLLLRGPAGTGKRWVARQTRDILTRMGNQVETMARWFGVSPSGQLWIDSAQMSAGISQIQRSSVLIVENVPPQPQFAQAFFSHLDFTARMIRASKATAAESPPETFTAELPESLPFGGLQIIATQNDPPENSKEQQQLSTAVTAAAFPPSTSSTGLVLNTTAPQAYNVHPSIFTVLFR
jgi:hypothetical protein